MPPIRPMTRADAERVADLTTQLGYPSTTAEIDARLAGLDRADDAAFVAVDDADAPIGWVHVGLHPSLASSAEAVIGGLVVDERHRSAGIGEALMVVAEAWARERGVRTMIVRSRVTRERAHRFYERLGYRLVKTSHVLGKPLV